MSKKIDHKSTLATLLAQENIDQATWTRIFQLSAILNETELKKFHESVTKKIQEASEDQLQDLFVTMAKEGRLETAECFKAEFLATHSNEVFMAFLQSGHPNHKIILDIMSDLAPWMDLASKDKNGFTLLERLIMRGGEEAAVKLLLEEASEDRLQDLFVTKDKNGFTLLERLIMRGEEAAVKLLLEEASEDRLQDLFVTKDKNGFTLLERLIMRGEEAAVKLLLESAVDIDTLSQDENGQTILSKLVPLIYSTKDEHFKEKLEVIFAMLLKQRDPQITKEEIEQQKKLSLAKEMLNLTYSKNDAPSRANLAAVFLETLPHLNLSGDKQGLWGEILSKISSHDEFATPNGTFLKARESGLKEHQSYFIIERNAQGNVVSLYYGDGNNISRAEQQRLEKEIRKLGKREKGVSLHRFELKRDKKSESEKEISSQIEELNIDGKYQYHAMKFAVKDGVTVEQLSTSLKDLFEDTDISDLDSRLSAIVGDYAKLDDESRPMVDMLVPAKQQARGNCVWKAFAILIRAILQEVYGKEIQLVCGKPRGEGYDLYKEFKEALISFFASQIVEMSDPKNAEKFFYKEACQFLKEVLEPNLESKTATDSGGQSTPDETEVLNSEFVSDWWRLEIRSLCDDEECVILLEALKKGLVDLLEHQEIFPDPAISGTLPRIKKSKKGVAEEGDFALLKSKDKTAIEFLVRQEFAARDALVSDPNDLTHIANLMLCLLGTATTYEEAREFAELKLSFLKRVKEPKQPAYPTITALASQAQASSTHSQ